MITPVRGQVYRADVGHGAKPWLVVSNNLRNRVLPTVIAVRVTTSDNHPDLPTRVPLTSADPLVGYIVADDFQQIHRTDLGPLLGTLAPRTILQVNTAVKLALAIP